MVRHYEPTDADRRLAAVVCAVVAGCLALDAWVAHPAGLRAEIDSGGTVGAIIGIANTLKNLFGGGKVDSGSRFALSLLRNALLGIGEQLTNYATETTGKQSKGVGILIRLWDSVLLPFIEKSDSSIRKIYNWLKDTFGPVVNALLWLRKHVIDFYGKYFKPIFDTIDAVRGMLRLLGLLHIEAARKLDEKLAALEHRLLAPLRIALETINTLIDWTERVIDGNGFFQRYTLIRSLLLHERDALKVWWHTIGRREIDTKTPADPPAVAHTPEDFGRSLAAYLDHRGGEDAARITEWGQDLALTLERRLTASV